MEKCVNRLKYNLIITPLLVFLLIPLCTFAAEPLVLSSATNTFRLGGSSLDILEDKTSKLTISDVVSPRYTASFKQSQQQIPNFGMTDSAFWFRFTIDQGNHCSEPWLLLLDQPLMNQVDLYIPRDDGWFDRKRSGDLIPMSSRDL